MNVTTNETFAHATRAGGARAPCAKRLVLRTLPSYEIHLFESSVTPEGPVPIAAWVAYWRALHAGFNASRADAWDGFMFNSQTFYSPDLTPFVRRLRGAGVPVFAARYERRVADIADREDDATVFSASVVLPGTGHLVEVRSAPRSARRAFDRGRVLSLSRARAPTLTRRVRSTRARRV